MKAVYVIFIFWATLFPSVCASAVPGEDNGISLLQDCKDAVSFLENGPVSSKMGVGFCLGEVRGVVDFIRIEKGTFFVSFFDVCFPQGSSLTQAIRVVVRYIETHPEFLHKNRASLIIEALLEAFPCPKLPPDKSQKTKQGDKK